MLDFFFDCLIHLLPSKVQWALLALMIFLVGAVLLWLWSSGA